jgi:DNA-binding NarL/FixJ family response regulator
MAVRRNVRSCPACLLVIDGDPQRAASTTHALRSSSTRALKVTIVSGAADALEVISREPVLAVLIEHRPAAGSSEQHLRAVVEGACGRPVVWLIENDAIVEIAEAIAAGVSGAFYWDQLGPELLSVIDRLAVSAASDPALLRSAERVAVARIVSLRTAPSSSQPQDSATHSISEASASPA